MSMSLPTREKMDMLIRATGLTNRQLAKELGIHPNSITEYVKGRTKELHAWGWQL